MKPRPERERKHLLSMPKFDLLMSADLVCADAAATAGRLVGAIGMPRPGRNAELVHEDRGYRVVWGQINRSRVCAPTLLELFELFADQPQPDFMDERIEAQGKRPIRTHATVLTTSDLPALIDHLRANDVRHRVAEPDQFWDFSRVWVGVSEEEPGTYDPSADAGLWLEFMPTEAAGLPQRMTRTDHGEVPPGKMARIQSRRYLVADLDDAIAVLQANFGLEPCRRFKGEAYDRAEYGFQIASSARLELVQSNGAGGALDSFIAEWGPGAHAITIAVRDLDAFVERLVVRGTPFVGAEPGELGPARVLLTSGDEAPTPFEFVDLRDCDQ